MKYLYRTLFCTVALSLGFVTGYAMDKKTQKNNSVKVENKAEAVVIQNKTVEDATTSEIISNDVQQEIEEPQDNNQDLQKQLDDKNKIIESIQNKLNCVEKNYQELLAEKYKTDSTLKAHQQLLATLDKTIYKQCLLYPLERQYKESLIQESIITVQSLKGILETPSVDFKECEEVYLPLVKSYKNHNQELIRFIKDKLMIGLKMLNWKVTPERKESYKESLENLKYYKQYYIGRNKPPYRSIDYLDKKIDELLKIINKSANLEQDLNDLLKSLGDIEVASEKTTNEE